MFGRSLRLRRYRRQVDRMQLDATASHEIVDKLASLWQGFRIKDLLACTAHDRAKTPVMVWIPNLPDLVTEFGVQTTLILKEKDRTLDLRSRQGIKVKETVSLELYLSDRDGVAINETDYLRRLQGFLQEHAFVVKRHPNQFYQRLSEGYYEDIIELTYALLNANLPETTID